MYKHILIPTDGSDRSSMAIEQGLQLAKVLGSKVTFLAVVEPQVIVPMDTVPLTTIDFLETAHAEAEKYLAEATARAGELGVMAGGVVVDSSEPAGAIALAAEEAGADLIAMGSHGRSGLKALVLGSVTTRVLNESKVPVIVYR